MRCHRDARLPFVLLRVLGADRLSLFRMWLPDLTRHFWNPFDWPFLLFRFFDTLKWCVRAFIHLLFQPFQRLGFCHDQRLLPLVWMPLLFMHPRVYHARPRFLHRRLL